MVQYIMLVRTPMAARRLGSCGYIRDDERELRLLTATEGWNESARPGKFPGLAAFGARAGLRINIQKLVFDLAIVEPALAALLGNDASRGRGT